MIRTLQRQRPVLISLALLLALQACGTALAQATPGASPAPTPSTDWWRGATCYEIFVRSFADSDGDGNGDLTGLIDKLDYLNDGNPGEGDDLGVNCIWLMPVMQSPSYHGYDVTDYRTIEEDYGTNDDFLRLMDEAHTRGIHVIIDFPINHTSAEHPWFQDATSDPTSDLQEWYIFEDEDPGYSGPWNQQVWHPNPSGAGYYYGIFDSSMPDLDYTNPAVTAEIERITRFWLIDMGVDGFRLDAVKHVIEVDEVQENTPQSIQWLQEYAAFIRSVKPDTFAIGEVNPAGTDGLQPYYPDTLDAYFQFELAQAMVNASSFGSPRQLIPILAGSVERLPDQRWGTFLTNHDQERIASQIMGGDPGKLRVAAMLLLSFPGTPFIYYGEEIGLPGVKPDELIRTPMPWSADPHGGFTTGTPWQPLQPGWESRNVADQASVPDSVLAIYRAWGQLREIHPSLQIGSYLPIASENHSILAFARQTDEETVLVFINLGETSSEELVLTAPDGISGTTTDLLTGTPGVEIASDGMFTLPPMEGRSGTVVLLDQ